MMDPEHPDPSDKIVFLPQVLNVPHLFITLYISVLHVEHAEYFKVGQWSSAEVVHAGPHCTVGLDLVVRAACG